MRHKEGAKGKVFTGAGRRGFEWEGNTKRENWREKDIERERGERKKVRQGDGECSGEKGYLCLGVVGTAGRFLKGSQV